MSHAIAEAAKTPTASVRIVVISVRMGTGPNETELSLAAESARGKQKK
jgi:hypothetical protein